MKLYPPRRIQSSDEVKLIYQKPKDLRVLSNVDSSQLYNEQIRWKKCKWCNPYNWRHYHQLDIKDSRISDNELNGSGIYFDGIRGLQSKFLQQLFHGITFFTMMGILLEENTGVRFIWLEISSWDNIQNTLTCTGTSSENWTRETNSWENVLGQKTMRLTLA
jgi:hypothetical protein